MNITPDIVRCEFIGTQATVKRSGQKSNLRVSGRVVNETRNTFTILHEGRNKVIAKYPGVFHFRFPDKTIVEVEGRILLGRPEDRLRKSIRRLW